MKIQQHEICLESQQHFGGRLPTHHLGFLLSELPVASRSRLDPNRLRKTQGARSGMAAIMGRWPGAETDEEIEAALEQIS